MPLNKEKLKALRNELQGFKERIELETGMQEPQEDKLTLTVQGSLSNHLLETLHLIHVFWSIAPTDDDSNKV